MYFQNQKGLTLVEVLVSILILAGGCVYVLQALAKSAEVQHRIEENAAAFPFLASKLAQIEARVQDLKQPFKSERGQVKENGRLYQWAIASSFHSPEQAALPLESLGVSVLLEKKIALSLSDKKIDEGFQLYTLARAEIPENKQ